MSAERYVLVGVTRARARWVSDLARWATDGAAPIEFVSCLSATEAGAVLGTGRRVSALLLDARGPGIDRDLIDAARAADIPSIVVTDGTVHRDWSALGCTTVIEDNLDPASLARHLQKHARPVGPSRRPGRSTLRPTQVVTGRVFAVVGTGGSGTSTVAMALAQAASLSSDSIVLLDGAGRGSLAMYHGLGDVVPGLPELVEAHRSDNIDPDDVRALTHEVPSRGYRVLLGRRRMADWVTLRRRSVDAALATLARTFTTLVIDMDAEFDDRAETGSSDVEDRHAVNLAAIDLAHVVLVVGRSGLHGLHNLTAVIEDLLDAGVPAHRVVPVITDAPMSKAARMLLRRTIDKLTDSDDGDGIHRAVMLRHFRSMEDIHNRVDPMPGRLVDQLHRSVVLGSEAIAPRPHRTVDPEPVTVGDLDTDIDDRVQLFRRSGNQVA